MTTLILQGQALTPDLAGTIAETLHGVPEQRTGHWRISTAATPAPDTLAGLRQQFKIDINALPPDFAPGAVRLLISDMDSTLINICLLYTSRCV